MILTDFQLRYYQEEAVSELFRFFWEHPDPRENPIIALPTGTGKSYVIAEWIRRAMADWPSTRVMIATHVKELVEQNHLELLGLWPTAPAGIYSAGLRRKEMHLPITFCGIQSVANAINYFGHIDILIVDECHMISPKSVTLYQKAIAALRVFNPRLRVIGLTATPYRLQLGLLTEGELFTHIVTDYTSYEKFNELVDNGFISPLIPKRTGTELSTAGVGIQGGEFIQEQLQAAVDKEAITRAALEEAMQLGWGRKHWLVFTTGTLHADHTRNILREYGVPSVCVHSDMSTAEETAVYLRGVNAPILGTSARDMNVNAFKSGHIGAMVNVNVLTTGFNFKPIDFIIFLRPTMSSVLWVQALGRGTRVSPETGKTNCLVLDFAANTRRLGPINDPVIPRPKGKRKPGGMVPYKICPVCNAYNHARARFCIGCQTEFPQGFNGSEHASTEELIRRDKPEPKVKPPSVVEVYPVDRVEFHKHRSRDESKPPSLRVTYYSGMRNFNEWLCLEHASHFARHKARQAWRLMARDPDCEPPTTIDEALELVSKLHPPSTIRVLEHDKRSDVVGYDFDKDLIPDPLADERFVASEADLIPF